MKRSLFRKNLGLSLGVLLIATGLMSSGIFGFNPNPSQADTTNDASHLGLMQVADASSAQSEQNKITLINTATSSTGLVEQLQTNLDSAFVKLTSSYLNQILNSTQPRIAEPVTPIAFSGKGTVEDGHFFSPILNKTVPYRVYMPPNYRNSNQHYPVLYMLHGLSGSYLEWIDYKLFDTVDSLITQGKIKPIIIVLPSGDQEYWVDHANGGLQWGEYVAHDVVNYIDATYRTLPNRENRAIGGHSMGGHGSLQIAFNYAQTFSVVGAHSPTLRTKDQAASYFGDEAWYAGHDPVSLAEDMPTATLKSLKIWIDIGNQDEEWRPRAEELNQVLNSRGIDHQWNEWEGGHAGEYWISHVGQYLQFYANNMSGK